MQVQNTLVRIALKSLAVAALISLSSGALADGETVAPSSGSSSSSGIENATGERLATAVGHYSRARSLLIAAINEFDKGYKIANPDAVLDAKIWRNTLIDRAEELQKVTDPQPRVTRGGVKFEADTRLLNQTSR